MVLANESNKETGSRSAPYPISFIEQDLSIQEHIIKKQREKPGGYERLLPMKDCRDSPDSRLFAL